jgi:hypothetical protein
MPDPKPPRPEVFPPPLPGSFTEPFRRVDSAPPPVNRSAVTPRDGSVAVLDADPRDGMIRDLQAQLVLLREQLDQGPETPVPLTRPSVRARRAIVAKALGKYAAIGTVLLPVVGIVGRAVARKHPELQQLIDQVLEALGL